MVINTLFLQCNNNFIAFDGFFCPSLVFSVILLTISLIDPTKWRSSMCQTVLFLLFSSTENVKKKRKLLTKKIELYTLSCCSNYTVVLFHYFQRISTDIIDHGCKMDKIEKLLLAVPELWGPGLHCFTVSLFLITLVLSLLSCQLG